MNKLLVLVATIFLAVSPAFGFQDAVAPRADENLKEYKARMDAQFAPLIAEHGLRALVEDEGGAYNRYRRFLQVWEPRLHPHGDFKEFFRQEAAHYNRRGRRRAVGHAEQEPGAALAAATLPNTAPWQELGPRSKPSSSVGAEGTGPTEFIVFYGPTPSRMLCGSLAGGLFYSTNGGVTWSSTGTDTQIGRSGVGTAAFHPSDYRIWFAASGGNSDNNLPAWIGFTGGIFRTDDEGTTWTQIARESQLGGIWTKIYKVAGHPSNANRLWAATSSGLYVTNNALDAKPQWTAVAPLQGESIYDFELRPGDPRWLYATAATWSGGNLTNWRYMFSDDDGATWQNVANPPSSAAGATGLTIEVSRARPHNLYMVTIGPGGNSELHIYDFASGTRSLVFSGASITHGGGHSFGVDPVNPNEIFLSQGTEGRRYTAGANPPYFQFKSSYFGGTYHPDIEDLIPHPVNVDEVWMCHHGGVAVSFDNGATWQDRTNGIGTAQVLRMATASGDPSYVAVGTYHDGTMVTTTPWHDLWSPAWKQFQSAFCDGLRPLISPTGQFMWHSCQSGGWYRSADFGQTFASNSPPYSPTWISEAVFNRVNPTTQFRLSVAGNGSNNVMRSTDSGMTWLQIAEFETLFPAATHEYFLWKAYTPETNGNYLLVHLLEKPRGSKVWWRNHLLRTTAANAAAATVKASWTELPLPIDGWMSDLDFDPADPNVVYITNTTSTPHLDRTAGKDMVFRYNYNFFVAGSAYVCPQGLCRDLTQNLPNASTGTDSLAVANSGDGGLYLATDYGAWYSNDATRATGDGWVQLGTGFPNTIVNGLEINETSRKVRVATLGRGVWEHDLVSTLSGMLFHDLNHNGVRDTGEPPLAGWNVTLESPAGDTAMATTDANGRYTFSALAAGGYVVKAVLLRDWQHTAPAAGARSVQVTAGTVVGGVDFGNELRPRSTSLPPPPDLAAWWTFNEPAGSSPQDSAGFGNLGTLIGNPLAVEGKVGKALRFDGASQYVEIGSHPELNAGTGDFSIDAWVRTTRNGLQVIVDKRNDPPLGFSLAVLDGRLGFQLADRPGSRTCSTDNTVSACTNWFVPSGSQSLADGQWHHVAVTVDRDQAAGGLLYVDGAIALVFDPTIRNRSLDNEAPLRIAASGAGSFWQGDIDEVAFFKRALSAYEVQSMYKAGQYGLTPGIYTCNPQCVASHLYGGKVVFSSDRVQPPQLFVQAVGSHGVPRQLTEDFWPARNPKWSRNGKYIVYITNDVIVGPTSGPLEVLRVMDDRLPNYYLTVPAFQFNAVGLGYPQWSDDGMSIVVMLVYASGKRGIGLIRFASPDNFETKTFTTVFAEGGTGINPGEPVFSLDGQTVYFGADTPAGSSMLYSVPAAGGTPVPITDDTGVQVRRFFAPSLSPDGLRLMYNSEMWREDPVGYQDEEILELDLLTRQIKRITSEPGNQYGFFAKNGAGEFVLQSNNPASAQYELFLQEPGNRIPFDVADPQNLWKESPDWWKPACGGGTVLWQPNGDAAGCKFSEWGPEQRNLCASWPRVASTGNSCAVCLAAPWTNPNTWNQLKEGTVLATAQPADLSCLSH